MSTPLVPIAISSQIDASGDERVHAAVYTREVRSTWNAPTLSVVGDLPNGTVGDTGTYTYTLDGGTRPYPDGFSLLSGALPGGASLSLAGVVTYDYTRAGTFSWVVQGTDAVGVTATLADTAFISNGMWLASSLTDGAGTDYNVLKTVDGLDWTTRARMNALSIGQLIFSGTRVVCYSGTTLSYSDDLGETWTAGTTPSTKLVYNGIYWGGKFWIPARDTGLYKTTTGIDSFVLSKITGLDDYTIVARTGLMVRAGYVGRAAYSTDDGATWSGYVQAVGASDGWAYSAATNGTRIMLGGFGSGLTTKAFAVGYSDTGSSWTQATLPFVGDTGTSSGFTGVVGLSYSPVLDIWVAGTASATTAYAGQFAWSDNNGATWHLSTSTLGGSLRNIRWGGDRFMAVGSSGKMAYSIDGKNWVAVTNNFTSSDTISSVCPLY